MNGEILPPVKQGSGSEENDSGGSNNLYIGQFHYNGNDLTELRKLSENDPVLARRVVENADKQDNRHHVSERFGIASAVVLLGMSMLFVTLIIMFAGLWATLFAISLILAVALLIRVILTGEWSETTWFGRFVAVITKGLGSQSSDKANSE